MQISRELSENKTQRRIIQLLKSEGPMDAGSLSKRLEVTPMAIRQHLYALQEENLVTFQERPGPVGRPGKFWELTTDANRLFPEAYAELTVALLKATAEALGPEALEAVLEHRAADQRANYSKTLEAETQLSGKLDLLAAIRTREGYMAEAAPHEEGGFLLVEKHCPICAAAASCQGLCRLELELFRSVLGAEVSVERVEHLLAGQRRCAYRVMPKAEVEG
ncbi:MAG: transcriptional regulator [Akkermansiaceae bacterium]|nr:transcriptional regulator [Akkermansiaceae bacterium]